MNETGALARRPIAGTRLDTSVLGMEINPPPTSPLEQDNAAAASIRRWVACGITTFDLSRARSVRRAVRLVRMAFAQADARVLLILGLSTASSQTGLAPPVLASVGGPSLRTPDHQNQLLGTIHSVPPAVSVLVDWDPGSRPPLAMDPTRLWLDQLTEEGTIVGWSLRRRSTLASPHEEDQLTSKSPVSAELSLLEHGLIDLLATRFSQEPGSVLVRDPFASGRLDGTRILRANEWPTPSVRPVDLASLRAEFNPVLRLAPLTRDRRRTLAQASIQYLLRWPWVATVILPPLPIGRWDEIRGAFSAPALEPAELEPLGLLPRGNGAGRDESGPVT